jgi:hypothetical protein
LKCSKEIIDKLLAIVKKMNMCDSDFSKKMSCKMPQALYQSLKYFGLIAEIDV